MTFDETKFSITKPTLRDIPTMRNLILPEVQRGIILDRTEDEMATSIRSYSVVRANFGENSGKIIAFSALHIHSMNLVRSSLRAYASQLQNDWGENRKPARTPEDYARVSRIAVEKGFDAVKLNFLTFHPENGRYPETEQTAFLNPAYMEVAEARIAAVREAVGKNVDIILENHCYTDKLSATQ